MKTILDCDCDNCINVEKYRCDDTRAGIRSSVKTLVKMNGCKQYAPKDKKTK